MRIRFCSFSPRAQLTHWRKLIRSRPYCSRKRVQHRQCQPVDSLVGHLGLHCPPLGTLLLGSLSLWCPPQAHQASRARRKSEPTASRVVASMLFGDKSQKYALTAPEGAGALTCFCWTRGALIPYIYGTNVQLIRLEAWRHHWPLVQCRIFFLYHWGIRSLKNVDQGYGREVPPIFTAGSEPLARVTLCLTDKNRSAIVLVQRSTHPLSY